MPSLDLLTHAHASSHMAVPMSSVPVQEDVRSRPPDPSGSANCSLHAAAAVGVVTNMVDSRLVAARLPGPMPPFKTAMLRLRKSTLDLRNRALP